MNSDRFCRSIWSPTCCLFSQHHCIGDMPIPSMKKSFATIALPMCTCDIMVVALVHRYAVVPYTHQQKRATCTCIALPRRSHAKNCDTNAECDQTNLMTSYADWYCCPRLAFAPKHRTTVERRGASTQSPCYWLVCFGVLSPNQVWLPSQWFWFDEELFLNGMVRGF